MKRIEAFLKNAAAEGKKTKVKGYLLQCGKYKIFLHRHPNYNNDWKASDLYTGYGLPLYAPVLTALKVMVINSLKGTEEKAALEKGHKDIPCLNPKFF